MREAFAAEALWPAATLPFLEGAAPGAPPPSVPNIPQNVSVLRAATAGYASPLNRGGADPAALAVVVYPPRIIGRVEIGQSATDALGVGGRVALTVGEIEVHDADGWTAEMARYGTADGRAARLRVAQVRDPVATDFGSHLADVPTSFSGVVRAVSRAGDFRGRVEIGDLSDRLDVPLQPNLYGGAGGQDGGEALAGRPKPVLVGRCFNVAPVFLGNLDLGVGIGSLPTYQVHWRAVEGIDTVRVRGVPLAGNLNAPAVGQFRAFNALGLFQLGGAAESGVRADVRGDAVPTYASTVGGILDRLLRSLGPQLANAEMDTQAWALANVDLPGEVGWFRGADPTTAMSACEEICRSCGAVLAGGRTGSMQLFDPFAEAAPQFTVLEPWIADLRPEPTPAALRPPPNEIRVEWGRNWAPDPDLAGIVAPEQRERIGSTTAPYARALSETVTSRVSRQRPLIMQGLYFDKAAAQARADKIRSWVALGPRFITLTTDRFLGQVELGHVGSIASYGAYGLDAGMSGVVVAWREFLDERRLEITMAEIKAKPAEPGTGSPGVPPPENPLPQPPPQGGETFDATTGAGFDDTLGPGFDSQ